MQTNQSDSTQTSQSVQPAPVPTFSQAVSANLNAILFLIAFVIIIILLAVKKTWEATSVRIVGITTIACLGVFAALTVANEKNGPAVFGLLGTIGGYLLGRSDRPRPQG